MARFQTYRRDGRTARPRDLAKIQAKCDKIIRRLCRFMLTIAADYFIVWEDSEQRKVKAMDSETYVNKSDIAEFPPVTLSEFRVIVPQRDDNDFDRKDLHNKIIGHIVRTFGGFTVTEGYGGYIMRSTGRLAKEPVYIFDIATAKDSADVLFWAESLASGIKRDMGQESVYFRNVDGKVYIL